MKVVDSYAASARTRTPEQLAAPVLRTRSVSARQILARLASGGECEYEQIVSAVAEHGAPPAATLADVTRRSWLAVLARIMAAQGVHHDDPVTALTLFDAIVGAVGPGELDAEHQAFYGQLLYLHEDFQRADALLPKLDRLRPLIAEYLRIDLANPFVRPDQDTEAWLELLNGPAARAGLERIRLLDEGATPFDRLSAPTTAEVDGPLASVIMSAYKPDDALYSAVRSILEQTWRNLELIVVDDASGPEYDDHFAAVARMDTRVRVIRREANRGTYVVRNAGLAAAHGDFVTFQDSDDWSHPRRIEHQIAPLLADERTIGTRSLAVRATDTLSHQWLGYQAQRVNASSLMFRRTQVLDKIGYFDSVRKSADFEFAFRLEAAFDRKITDVQQPLAYTRLRQASLSRSDFTPGWAAPARIAYQAAYLHWHKAISGGASAYLPDNGAERPFPAPAPYLRQITETPQRTEYDVVLVDDWVSFADSVDGALEQIAILTGRGLSVGIVHAESVVRMASRRRHIDALLQDKVNDGTVDRLTLDQDVKASLVIVRDPAVLQFTQYASAQLRADKVLITAQREPAGYPGVELAYDEQDCLDNARMLFGVEPRWAGDLDASPIELSRWATPRNRRRSNRPVIGQCAPDAAYVWPATPGEQLLVYPPFGDVDVRILAGSVTASRLRRRKQRGSWLIYHRDQISLRAFLNQLDFFVCFPGTTNAAPPLDLLFTAMASGAVVVLPERLRAQFGDAAVFCAAEEVVETVQRLYAAPSRYAEQVAAGRRFVADRHSAEVFQERVAAELPAAAP